MNLGILTKDLRITPRKFAAVTLLNSGSLAWFFLLILNIEDIFETVTLGNPFWVKSDVALLLFFGSGILWAIVGSLIGRKVDRRKLFVLWITLGVFSTISLNLFQGTIFATIACLLLGVSLGLGLPSSTALVGDYTVAEERARVSGITIMGTFVLAFVGLGIMQVLDFGPFNIILLIAAVRAISLLALIVDKCDVSKQDITKKKHFQIAAFREFIMYVFPWVMFSIAAGLAWNLIPGEYEAEIAVGSAIRSALIAVFGLVWGVVADRIGRKWPIIIGLVMLGIGFNILAFNLTGISVIVYFALAGIAWGSFFVMFLAVPGDLSSKGSREKFYGVGYILPLAILFSLSTIPGSFLKGFPASSFAQILSAILFLSIIPVLRAKETLHESIIHERKMRDYAEKVAKEISEGEEDQ